MNSQREISICQVAQHPLRADTECLTEPNEMQDIEPKIPPLDLADPLPAYAEPPSHG
jgi:hypothetical protein